MIQRSDGTPTYHPWNLVDDDEQGATKVMRGENLTNNTPELIHLQCA